MCQQLNIAFAIGKGIVFANDQTLLKENVGSLNIDFHDVNQFFKKLTY